MTTILDLPADSRRDALVLDPAQCREVLARVGWGVLATVDDVGFPYAVPVRFALGRDCLYLASGDGEKRRNMEEDPRLCLTVTDIRGPEEWQSVVVRGLAVPMDGFAERAAAMAAFVARIAHGQRPRAADMRRLNGARFFRVSLDAMTGRGREP